MAYSNSSATEFLNKSAKMSRLVGDNKPVFTEKTLIDGWYAFSAAHSGCGTSAARYGQRYAAVCGATAISAAWQMRILVTRTSR
mmetsp:Transcript_26725/g.82052  ORF Transcript_26725/g.82052 Transcript_26725/m.82052 type:complete len:84 (+) Transcript_26725:763-1014(+)